ncbi:hypothetical protein WICPIJ_003128, partial [Wickerhamomyces pijperi]
IPVVPPPVSDNAQGHHDELQAAPTEPNPVEPSSHHPFVFNLQDIPTQTNQNGYYADNDNFSPYVDEEEEEEDSAPDPKEEELRPRNKQLLTELYQTYPASHIDSYLTTINSEKVSPSPDMIKKTFTKTLKPNELKEALNKAILMISKDSLRNSVLLLIVRRIAEVLNFDKLKFDGQLLNRVVELLPLRESLDVVDDFEHLERDPSSDVSTGLLGQALVQFDIVASFYDTDPRIEKFLQTVDVVNNFEYVPLANLLYASRHLAVINAEDNPVYRHMKDKLRAIITNMNAEEIFLCLNGKDRNPTKALWSFYLSTDPKLIRLADGLILRSTSSGSAGKRLAEIVSRDLSGNVKSFFKILNVSCQEKRLMDLRFFVVVKEVLVILNDMHVFRNNSEFKKDTGGMVGSIFKLLRFVFDSVSNQPQASTLSVVLLPVESSEDHSNSSEVRSDDLQMSIVEFTHTILNMVSPISKENCAKIQQNLTEIVKICLKWFEQRYRSSDLIVLSSLLRLTNKLIDLVTGDVQFRASDTAVKRIVNKLVVPYHQKLLKTRDEQIKLFEFDRKRKENRFDNTWDPKLQEWKTKENELSAEKTTFEDEIVEEELDMTQGPRRQAKIKKKYEALQSEEFKVNSQKLPWEQYRTRYIDDRTKSFQKRQARIDHEKKEYEIALDEYNKWLSTKGPVPSREYEMRVLHVLQRKSFPGSGDSLLKFLLKLNPEAVIQELQEFVQSCFPNKPLEYFESSVLDSVAASSYSDSASVSSVPFRSASISTARSQTGTETSSSLHGASTHKRKKSVSASPLFMAKKKRKVSQQLPKEFQRYTVAEAKEKMRQRESMRVESEPNPEGDQSLFGDTDREQEEDEISRETAAWKNVNGLYGSHSGFQQLQFQRQPSQQHTTYGNGSSYNNAQQTQYSGNWSPDAQQIEAPGSSYGSLSTTSTGNVGEHGYGQTNYGSEQHQQLQVQSPQYQEQAYDTQNTGYQDQSNQDYYQQNQQQQYQQHQQPELGNYNDPNGNEYYQQPYDVPQHNNQYPTHSSEQYPHQYYTTEPSHAQYHENNGYTDNYNAGNEQYYEGQQQQYLQDQSQSWDQQQQQEECG